MKKYQWLLLIGIFLLSLFLRFYDLEHIPPGIHGDEAEFGLIEQKINHGLYTNLISLENAGADSFSVLSFWIQGLFQLIFGENVFGIRASSAFIGTVTVILFFFAAKLFFRNIFITFILTFTFATSHYHIAYSRMALNNIWTTFFTLVVFYFLVKGLLTKKLYNFITSGVFLGLSLYFAQSSRAIPIVTLLGSILYLFCSKKFKKNYKDLIILFGTSILVFIPQIIYFFKYPGTLTSRINTVSIFNHLSEYYDRYHVDNIFEILFWQFVNTIKVFNFGGDIGFYFYGYQGGLLAPIVGLFTVIGLLLSFFKIRENKYLFFLIWFFTIIILGGTITIDAPSSQRLVGLIPVLFIFVGVTLEQLMKHKIHYLKIILTIIFIINGFWDYKIYFKDYINSQAGWAQREPATQIAYYLQSLGSSWKVYMLRENTWLYFHHGTILFLNPDLEGVDVDNSKTVISLKETTIKNIVYIMPPNSPSLLQIKKLYPQGTIRHFSNEITKNPSFISYEIKNTSKSIFPQTTPLPFK